LIRAPPSSPTVDSWTPISALRLPCYSCMSPYLEDHYPYISHLYRKPLSFDVHCDRNTLDRSYLFVKNCSDMCVTLRINDVVGGEHIRIHCPRALLSSFITCHNLIQLFLCATHSNSTECRGGDLNAYLAMQ
uniref:C-CAP/cofactor C-like domain-containing protein n=1 Tax=Heligmosomoides polygyrus TaxID=6339 RepID=A0A183G7V6_HELPZ